jgi:hypothetical protein
LISTQPVFTHYKYFFYVCIAEEAKMFDAICCHCEDDWSDIFELPIVPALSNGTKIPLLPNSCNAQLLFCNYGNS